jgi:hypothetical protein
MGTGVSVGVETGEDVGPVRPVGEVPGVPVPAGDVGEEGVRLHPARARRSRAWRMAEAGNKILEPVIRVKEEKLEPQRRERRQVFVKKAGKAMRMLEPLRREERQVFPKMP